MRHVLVVKAETTPPSGLNATKPKECICGINNKSRIQLTGVNCFGVTIQEAFNITFDTSLKVKT